MRQLLLRVLDHKELALEQVTFIVPSYYEMSNRCHDVETIIIELCNTTTMDRLYEEVIQQKLVTFIVSSISEMSNNIASKVTVG